MTDLLAFLRQQLDTDEQLARTATAGPWRPAVGGYILGALGFAIAGQSQAWNSDHIINHDPARVLRQVQAHRAILDQYEHQLVKQAENGAKFVALTKSSNLDQQEFTNVKTHGWELSGRVAALKFAVDTLVSIYSDRDGWQAAEDAS